MVCQAPNLQIHVFLREIRQKVATVRLCHSSFKRGNPGTKQTKDFFFFFDLTSLLRTHFSIL